MRKGKINELLFIKNKLIKDSRPSQNFSLSNIDKSILNNELNISKTISTKSLIRNSQNTNSTIEINYKGNVTSVSKKNFYKMKHVDIGKLKAHKKENIELIKQKKLFMKKEENVYDIDKINLISQLKEKAYREVITKLQKNILNKKHKKNEIIDYYKLILDIIKNITNQIFSEFEYCEKFTEKRINSDINKLNNDFQNQFDKNCEFSDILFVRIKELIIKMEIIIISYNKLNDMINYYNKENLKLKQQINDMNDINNSLSRKIKQKKIEINKIGNDSIKEEEKQKDLFFQKLKNRINKKYIVRENKINKISNKKMLSYNNNNIIQTYYTSNNANLLTNRNNSKSNILSFSFTNNSPSLSFSSIYNNQEKSKENIENKNIREINYIKKLKERIKIFKIKLMRLREGQTKSKNSFYELIIKIMNQIKDEESDIIINKIDNKLLNENMKMFPYHSFKVRKKFIEKLFENVNLYKILNSKNLEGIKYFEKNIFGKSNAKKP